MDNRRLKFKDYMKITLLFGFVYATIPIIITEILWDGIANIIGLSGILRELISAFLRAALLEELFKFYGFISADKKYHFNSKREYMLGAGAIGLAYGIAEKLATGNMIAIILGIIFPMHILWQMNQGRHFYAYRKAKEKGDNKRAKHELFKATFLIFLIHGCWDAIISIIEYISIDSELAIGDALGGCLLIATILFGTIYIVISIKKSIHVIKEDREFRQKSELS